MCLQERTLCAIADHGNDATFVAHRVGSYGIFDSRIRRRVPVGAHPREPRGNHHGPVAHREGSCGFIFEA